MTVLLRMYEVRSGIWKGLQLKSGALYLTHYPYTPTPHLFNFTGLSTCVAGTRSPKLVDFLPFEKTSDDLGP